MTRLKQQSLPFDDGLPTAVPWTPDDVQLEGMRRLVGNKSQGILADPGVGKTSITLGALKVHKKKLGRVKALVLATPRVAQIVWPEEVNKWIDFKEEFSYVVLHGQHKEELLHEDHDLYFMSYQALPWLLGVARSKTRTGKVRRTVDLKRVKALGFTHIIYDELTKVKNYAGATFKILKKVLQLFPRRWGLTGSPVANGLLGLFGQVYMLDRGATLGHAVTRFREAYFDQDPFVEWVWTPKEDCETRLFKKLAPVVFRISEKDAGIVVPTLKEIDIKVELPPDVMKMYRKFERQLAAELKPGVSLLAVHQGDASTKCRQLASGSIYLTRDPETFVPLARESRRVEIVHEAKLDALAELVDELQEEPVLIMYEFQHELVRLKHMLGQNTPVMGRGTTTLQAQMYEREWCRNKYPYMLCHPQAMAHGLNLQKGNAHHVAWFTLTWDYENYDQVLRRLRRRGNKSRYVYCHRLIATRTVDEDVAALLSDKESGQQRFFRGVQFRQQFASY